MILVVKELHKSYQEGEISHKVLKGISLEVEEGECILIQGSSGAGKSTLLNLIGGLDTPDRGEIYIQGYSLQEIRKEGALEKFRRKFLGFVFQFHYLLPYFSVVENIALPLWLNGVKMKEAKKRAFSLLERFSLSSRAYFYPDTLSGGEKQRVAFLRAIIHNPPLVLADEPTGNLDDENTEKMLIFIKELQEEFSSTFIIATHEDKFQKIATRSFLLQGGKLLCLV